MTPCAPSSPARTHVMPIEIGFKHCDPAGIVFYPRYVEMLNDVVEHWFKHGLSCMFSVLHGERALAIPIVDLHCAFKSPSRLGDTLQAELVLERLGRSSITMRITLRGESDGAEPEQSVRMSARLTAVMVQAHKLASVDVPADLRLAMAPYLEPAAAAD